MVPINKLITNHSLTPIPYPASPHTEHASVLARERTNKGGVKAEGGAPSSLGNILLSAYPEGTPKEQEKDENRFEKGDNLKKYLARQEAVKVLFKVALNEGLNEGLNLTETERDICFSRSTRLRFCGCSGYQSQFTWLAAFDKREGEKTFDGRPSKRRSLLGSVPCRSTTCPNCSSYHANEQFESIFRTIKSHLSRDDASMLVGVCTLPHPTRNVSFDEKKDLLDLLYASWRELSRSHINELREEFGFIAYVRKVEITFSLTNSIHPHIHFGMFIQGKNYKDISIEDIKLLSIKFWELWKKVVRRMIIRLRKKSSNRNLYDYINIDDEEFIKKPVIEKLKEKKFGRDYKVTGGALLEPLRENNIEELVHYFSKEIAYTAKKKGKGEGVKKSLAWYELLEDPTEQNLRLYVEYVLLQYHRRSFQYSNINNEDGKKEDFSVYMARIAPIDIEVEKKEIDIEYKGFNIQLESHFSKENNEERFNDLLDKSEYFDIDFEKETNGVLKRVGQENKELVRKEFEGEMVLMAQRMGELAGNNKGKRKESSREKRLKFMERKKIIIELYD